MSKRQKSIRSESLFDEKSEIRWYVKVRNHTIYPDNNMCRKCGCKSGLWVLHEIVNKTYAENMKKIVAAVLELPAKQHSQSSPFSLFHEEPTNHFCAHIFDIYYCQDRWCEMSRRWLTFPWKFTLIKKLEIEKNKTT